MQYSEHLHSRKIILRAVADGLRKLGNLVAIGVGDHGVDGNAHVLRGPFAARKQAALQNALPVAGNIADAPLFVNIMPSRALFALALGVDIRKLDDGTPCWNMLPRIFDDLLLFQKQLQPQRCARRQRKLRVLDLRADRIPAFAAQLATKCLDLAHSFPASMFVVQVFAAMDNVFHAAYI